MNKRYDETCEFTLAVQSDARAFFSKVTIAISSATDEDDLTISIDSAVDSRWHSAVTFGIEYAWEHLDCERSRRPSVAVIVTDVEWQPFDTTMMTVAFSAANAMWQALKQRPPKTPELDVIAGVFVFPN